MDEDIHPPAEARAGAETAFFSRTYDEAFALLRQARDYLRDHGDVDAAGLDPVASLAYSAETSRLTARLMHLMSWLFLQRAAFRGEITISEAMAEAPELIRIAICLEPPCIAPERLPGRLGELLDSSDRLYRRVARLDQMARQAGL